jgi:hypothetical protein
MPQKSNILFAVLLAVTIIVLSGFGIACAMSGNSRPRADLTVEGAGPAQAWHPVCATSLGGVPSNDNEESRHVLVPSAPSTALLCRYYGVYGSHDRHNGALARKRLLIATSLVRNLGRAFNSLAPYPDNSVTCPNDNGAGLYVLFHYEDEADVPVSVKLSGCRAANNGRMGRAFILVDPFLRQLGKLTHPNNAPNH